jgi:poly(3-hydroxybutyrate) depolymerase
MAAQIQEITGEGGVFACFEGTTKMGTDTGDAVYFTGDFALADQVLACSVQQGLSVDTKRIYTGGCSAGGLQAGWMLYGRSSYLAAVMPNSGGVVYPPQIEDPSHVPALITTHGKMGTDVVVIDFSTTSATEDKDVVSKKGFAVDCNHGGGHCGAPAADIAAQWQFCKDHPFGVSPEPYANGLPSSFPTYCTIIK